MKIPFLQFLLSLLINLIIGGLLARDRCPNSFNHPRTTAL